MEKSNKRGKIPQSDWPLIMGRYEAGETLASIARTYDCSPPAISYVVSKSRARQPSLERSAARSSGQEAQLLKSTGGESAPSGSAERLRVDTSPPLGSSPHASPERRAEIMSAGSDITAAPPIPQLGDGHSRQIPHEVDGAPHDGAAERSPSPARPSTPVQMHAHRPEGRNGQQAPVGIGAQSAVPSRNGVDTRHRLHLSLGSGASSYDGSGGTLFPSSARSADESRYAQGHAARLPSAAAGRPSATEFSEAAPGPDPMLPQHAGEAESGGVTRNREKAGAFIDQELRARVDTDICVSCRV